MTTDYAKQATDLLEKFDVTFSVQLLGDDCPKFCDDARKGKDMGLVNTFPRKSHIHGKHYLCTFRRTKTEGRTARNQSMTIDFWNSYADEEHNWLINYRPRFDDSSRLVDMVKAAKAKGGKQFPIAYDVLACITKNHPGTFEQFCSEFGYDEDSRSAFQTYEAVLMEWGKVSAFFTAEEIEQLQEVE